MTQTHPLCYFHICLLSCFPASSLCLDRVLCRLWTWLTSSQWPVCHPPVDAAFSRCVVGLLGCVSAEQALFKYTPVFFGSWIVFWPSSDRRASSLPGSYSCRWSWGLPTLRIHQGSGSHGSKNACFVAWEVADVRAPLYSGLRPPVSPVCQ